LLRADIAFVIKLAVATLGKFYAKPCGRGNAAQANVRSSQRPEEKKIMKMKKIAWKPRQKTICNFIPSIKTT
jgi:hypothetical protein